MFSFPKIVGWRRTDLDGSAEFFTHRQAMAEFGADKLCPSQRPANLFPVWGKQEKAPARRPGLKAAKEA